MLLRNSFFNQFQSLIKSKPLKIFEKFQNRQLNYTLDYISVLLGNVLHATQRPWEGRKSGWICGQVVEFMSVYGTCPTIMLLYTTPITFKSKWFCDCKLLPEKGIILVLVHKNIAASIVMLSTSHFSRNSFTQHFLCAKQ